MTTRNVNALTRKEQFYGSRELTQKVRKLDVRYDKSEDVRLPVIASVCLEIGTLPGGANFAAMTNDERLAFIKNNESLLLARFDDLMDLLINSVAEGKTLLQKQKWAIDFLEKQINILDPQQNTAITGSDSLRIRISTGVDILDSILAKIEPVEWSQYCTTGRNDEVKPPSEKVYILRTCERILETATKNESPIVFKQGQFYVFTGTHYKAIAELELQNFLSEAAICCGMPRDVAIYHRFLDSLTKQFYINAGRGTTAAEPDTAFINLMNGTLFFDKKGHRFEKHTPGRFIRYVLNFEYNPDATAPRWQQHLDRSLPHPEKQEYLAKCLVVLPAWHCPFDFAYFP